MHNQTIVITEMPDSPQGEHWRITLPAVSLSIGILASAVFALRVHASRLVSSKIRAEDVLMGMAVVLMWGTVTSVLLKAYNGIGIPGHQLPHDRKRLLNLGSWLVPKFWATSMTACKVSLILFLRRAVGFKRTINITLLLVAISTVLWTIAIICFTTLVCKPVSYYWDKSGQDGQCMNRRAYRTGNIVLASFAMAGDIIILVIPMPTLWRSQMRKAQKVAIMGLFGIGIVVCVFGLLRVAQFFYLDPEHLSTSSGLESLWTVLENEFSIFCGCAPHLTPLFRSLRSSTAKLSGYAGSFDTSALGKHSQMSVIRTTVRGQVGGDSITSLRPGGTEGRASSEIELRGIEVHTAINQEVSAESRRSSTGHSSTVLEGDTHTRL